MKLLNFPQYELCKQYDKDVLIRLMWEQGLIDRLSGSRLESKLEEINRAMKRDSK